MLEVSQLDLLRVLPRLRCSPKLWGTALVILVTMLGSNAAWAIRYPVSEVPMQVAMVAEDIYYVMGLPRVGNDNEGFISNAGFVVTDEGVVVFDALGTPSLAQALVAKIREKTDQPIKRVVVSHYHADHVYGLQVFKELGATVMAAQGSELYLESDSARSRLAERRESLFPWVDESTYLVAPDVIVGQSKSFTLGDKTFAINFHGKAHSDGDLSLLVRPERVLFSGDLIFAGRIPFVGSADTKQWLETLRALELEGLNALVPGHGPASTDTADTVSLTRRYLEDLRAVMIEGVEDLLSFEEIYETTDWSEFSHLPTFNEGNRLNANGVFLSVEEELLNN